MANEGVVQEIKKVLEITNESEEKVLVLQENLIRDKKFCQQMLQNLRDQRELNNINAAELEDNRHLKINIKNSHKQLLAFAQQIYSCSQQLYSDLISNENELSKSEELLNRNNEMFAEKLSEYREMEETLRKELEFIEIEEVKVRKMTESEGKALTAEYEELKAEEKMLDEQINHLNNNNNELQVLENDGCSTRIIEELKECVTSKDNEIIEVSKSLENVKQSREKLKNNEESTVTGINNSIDTLRFEIEKTSSKIEETKLSIDMVIKKLEVLEENNKNVDKKRNDYIDKLNEMEKNFKILEEANCNIITNCEKLVLENTETYNTQEQLGEKLKSDINKFEERIEIQQRGVDEISQFLAEHMRSDKDLNAILEAKENEKNELKVKHQNLKKDCDKRVLELESELTRYQKDIENSEKINNKLQKDTDLLVSELNQLHNDLEQWTTKKECQTRNITELDSQIQRKTIELAQKKRKIQMINKKSTNFNELSNPVSGTSTKAAKLSQYCWDSDSSVDEENRISSNLLKQKLRAKKMELENKSLKKL